jgi:hypothetical protein
MDKVATYLGGVGGLQMNAIDMPARWYQETAICRLMIIYMRLSTTWM